MDIEKLINRINLRLGFSEPFYSKKGAFTYDQNINGYQFQKYANDSGGVEKVSDYIKDKRIFYQMLLMFNKGMDEMKRNLITMIINEIKNVNKP